MRTNDGKTVKVMVSMSSAVYKQLELMSNILGSSKSRIVQQAIIAMTDVMKEAGYAMDKDVSSTLFKG